MDKYHSIASTSTQLAWITNLIGEFGIFLTQLPYFLCDDIGATFLCANPILHS